jgi:hypothetical protein
MDLLNCVLTGNEGRYGGAIYNRYDIVLINSTVYHNSSASYISGGLYSLGLGDTNVTNSIFWANSDNSGTGETAQLNGGSPTVSHCCIEGLSGFAGNGNIGTDPCFMDPPGIDGVIGTTDDNVRLSLDSSCIDAGDDAAVPVELEVDLDGHPRIADGDCDTDISVDMGAYEFSYVYYGGLDEDCDVDMGDIAVFSQAMLSKPGSDRWNPRCNLHLPPDDIIDFQDAAILMDHWLMGD